MKKEVDLIVLSQLFSFPLAKGSTTLNKELYQSAKKAALETKFEPKLSAPINQQGKITYTFQFIRESN